MDEDIKNLHDQLIRLQTELRSESKSKFNRINPFPKIYLAGKNEVNIGVGRKQCNYL